MARGSKKVVYAALLGNLAVAVSKFIVAGVSGSSAMLAEAFHSSADSCNELLLLVGIHRAGKPPTPKHPFGHGREVYFWSFLVAVLLFAFGGGLSVLEGTYRILHPQPPESALWSYLVLAVSAVFESITWVIGMRELLRQKREGRNLWEALKHSKDPNVMAVVFEDSAALVGLAIAALSVWASHHWHNSVYDGVASIAIGLLLVVVAFLFGNEVMDLLVGESADPEVVKVIRQVADEDPEVELAGDPVTMQLAPHQVLLNMELRFKQGLDRDGIEAAVDRIEAEIRRRAPDVTRIFLEAESFKGGPARKRAA
jgi:cation diffusion facilitator family transporter